MNSPATSILRGGEQLRSPESMPAIPLLGQVEILAVREGGMVEAMVPVDLIDHEEVPVKEEWAASLAKQMIDKASQKGGGSGQQAPILLGYVDSEPRFKIKDGFHRDAALRIIGRPTAYSSIEHTTWDALFNDRILTAKNHPHVRFSRVVAWIDESWQHSGMADKLKVDQAILLYNTGTDGTKLGLDPDTVETAKDWVARKEDQWEMKAMTIHGYLFVAKRVDPNLVHSTRPKEGGHKLTAPTQPILKVLADKIPGEDNFDLQKLVVEEAIRHNLSTPLVKTLATQVIGLTLSDAREAVGQIDWQRLQPEYADSKKRALRRTFDSRHKGSLVLRGAEEAILKTLERANQTTERGEEITPEMAQKILETAEKAEELKAKLGVLSFKLLELIGEADGIEETPATTGKNDDLVTEKQTTNKPDTETTQDIKTGGENPEGDEEQEEKKVREPKIRDGLIYKSLPGYGDFEREDWFTIEPRYRLALALSDPAITDRSFKGLEDFFRVAVLKAELVDDPRSIMQKDELMKLVKPLVRELVSQRNPDKSIVALRKADNKLVITDFGSDQLNEVVRNAKLEVDDIREENKRKKSSKSDETE